MGHRRPAPLWQAAVLLLLLLLLLLGALFGTAAAESAGCKVVNADGQDETLRFQQYTPREEVSRYLLKRATAEVRRVIKDVSSISFDIRGEDLKEKVGQHHINAKIQPSGACFTLHYTITPVNECEAPAGSSYRHRCHPSTQCLDTEQSYECVCPQGHEGEGTGRCGGKTSTAQCCGLTGADACKHAFVCVPSTAKGAHDGCKGQCVKEATCVQISKERDLWECRCLDDLFGNGKHCFAGGPPPPAIFDRHGVLQGPILAEDYCGCRPRTVDYCIGVDCGEHAMCVNGASDHKCQCEPGYSDVGGSCVDTQGLRVLLVGPKHVQLEQGDQYDDKLVRIQDENGMLHEARQISISMSDPVLNEDTIDQVGNYEIRYSVKAPWTNTPSITETRTIEVVDLNECALRPGDPKWDKWRPMCHPWADCVNTNGGYKCVCRPGTLGGGAAANASVILAEGHRLPENVHDGPAGCKDVQPPSLFVSDWEKTFKVCKCDGLGGPDTPPPAICQERARNYGKELSDLLFQEKRLCTGDWPCFEAYDDLADGTRQNLTHRVNPLQDQLKEVDTGAEEQEEGTMQGRRMGRRGARSIRRFELPIEVEDDAGNKAKETLRFNVEEISLWDVIQPDKPPVRSPTMPKVPPPPTRRPPLAPVPKTAQDKEVTRTARGLAAADAENETRAPASAAASTCESSSTTRTTTTTTRSHSGGTTGEPAVYDEEQGVAQLLFMLVVALLVAMCIWGTRGTMPPEVVAVGDAGADNPLDGSSTAFVYSESPNPLRSRSSPPTPATPLRAASPGGAPFSPHLN